MALLAPRRTPRFHLESAHTPSGFQEFLQTRQSEGRDKTIKHELLRTTIVAAVIELCALFPQMLSRNVDVRPFDRPFEMRPVAFNRVRVVDADHVFFL